jgi:ATP-binding cassette subfamily B protein
VIVVPADQSVEQVPTWRERLGALRYVPDFLRLVWRIHPAYAVAMVVLRGARAFLPVAILWVGKLILDAVVAAATRGADAAPVWQYLLLELALIACSDLLAEGSAVVESLLGDLVANDVNLRLMERATTLDLAQLEEPRVQDHLDRARAQTTDRIVLLAQLLSIGQDLVTLASFAVALLRYNAWVGVLLIAAALPAVIGHTHFAGLRYSLLFRFTPERRLLGYLQYVAAGPAAAKEVHVFGLGPWLVGRYRALARRFMAENRRLAVRRGAVAWLLSVLGAAAYYAGYATILVAAVRGTISIGQMVFLAASFARSRDLLQRSCIAMSQVHEQCLYLRDLFAFLALEPRIVTPPGARRVPGRIRSGFEVEGVGFRYPGSERWAVRHVSLALRPGERLALVGENGAGKTTLAKLLTRLYDPTEGRILLDGVDLRDYDLGSLRRAVGVLFQDFVRFQMRFDENIGIGQIESVADYLEASLHATPDVMNASVPGIIRTAAEQSLAASLLPRFPAGYQQMLGRHFAGGVDLSGGEWQRVALARAYMCDAQLLVLDEPTAALDARAEYEVFRRFSELTRGRMAVFITHRLWTVRMADRILVLTGGEVVEDGAHHELLARRGLYADLFGMQAAAYR